MTILAAFPLNGVLIRFWSVDHSAWTVHETWIMMVHEWIMMHDGSRGSNTTGPKGCCVVQSMYSLCCIDHGA